MSWRSSCVSAALVVIAVYPSIAPAQSSGFEAGTWVPFSGTNCVSDQMGHLSPPCATWVRVAANGTNGLQSNGNIYGIVYGSTALQGQLLQWPDGVFVARFFNGDTLPGHNPNNEWAGVFQGSSGFNPLPMGVPVTVGSTMDPNGCEVVAWAGLDVNNNQVLTWGVETYQSGKCLLESYRQESGTFTIGPALATYATGGTQVYWAFASIVDTHSNYMLNYRTYSGSSPTSGTWNNWTYRPITEISLKDGTGPAAIAPDSNHVYVCGIEIVTYFRGLPHDEVRCAQIEVSSGSWTWFRSPGTPNSAVSLSSPGMGARDTGHIDTCVRANDSIGTVYCSTFSAGAWSGWRSCAANHGGPTSSYPVAGPPTVSAWNDGTTTHTVVLAPVNNNASGSEAILWGAECD
jgi:hypothetical protein